MLRLLALLAGLVLLALIAVFLRFDREHGALAPEVPLERVDSAGMREKLVATEPQGRDEAGAPITAEARYVGIVGEVRREEDGSLVDGAVVWISYRYLSKGPDAALRKVDVDVDEHGGFDQLLSEPVQLVECEIRPAKLEVPDDRFWPGDAEMAEFLPTHHDLNLRVESRGTRCDLSVASGLELRGKVFDERTNEPVVHAQVSARVDVERSIVSYTRFDGTFRMRGFAVELSEPGRTYVAMHGRFDMGNVVGDLTLRANADRFGSARVVVPLPLSAKQPAFVEIPMMRGFRISGRVLDSDGTPLAGARLSVRTPVQELADDPDCPRGRTDEHGEFVLDGINAPEGAELRARHPWQRGPTARIALGTLREDHEGLELRLPESQCYRIELRDPKGAPFTGNCILRVRNSAGEHCIENMEVRLYLPIGERSEVLASCDSGSTFRPVVLHGKATIEPLVKREEPETVTIDLEP